MITNPISEQTLNSLLLVSLNKFLDVQTKVVARAFLIAFEYEYKCAFIQRASNFNNLQDFFLDQMKLAVRQQLKIKNAIKYPLEIKELYAIVDWQVNENLLLTLKNIDKTIAGEFIDPNSSIDTDEVDLVDVNSENNQNTGNVDKLSSTYQPRLFKSAASPATLARTASCSTGLSWLALDDINLAKKSVTDCDKNEAKIRPAQSGACLVDMSAASSHDSMVTHPGNPYIERANDHEVADVNDNDVTRFWSACTIS